MTSLQTTEDLYEYFAGRKLYGEDFSEKEIENWFQDEEQGYYELASSYSGTYEYSYHALNWKHGYRWLPSIRFGRALGMGSAYGDEFLPIIDRIDAITVLEPAREFYQEKIGDVPAEYIKPEKSGHMPFDSESFGLVVCLGTLHHIPNVRTVLREIHRCLRGGGFAVIREPTISLGDWREPRPGRTARERGIPLSLFDTLIDASGFRVVRRSRCLFGITPIVNRFLSRPFQSYRWAVNLDKIMCGLFSWNKVYHATNPFQKFRPTAVYYVLAKGH